MPSLSVIVHDLAQARAVLTAAGDAGVEGRLVSAPDAAAYAGVGFLAALETELGVPLLVDCGEDAGLVMAGLRAGLRHLLLTGDPRVGPALEQMAEALGGRLLARIPEPLIRLDPGEDPARRLAALLQRMPG